MSANTTIPLSQETRNKLRQAGHKGQTYDEIILELLKKKGAD
jgi:hypothetical protein